MKFSTKALLSLTLFSNCMACSLMFSEPVEDQSSEYQIELDSPVETIAEESDIWSIEVSSGESATMSAPVRARLQAPTRNHSTTDSQTSSSNIPHPPIIADTQTDLAQEENLNPSASSVERSEHSQLDAPERLAKNENSSPTARLYWRMPQSTVTHYSIRFGYSPTELSEELLVSVDELDEVKDEIQGLLYRYTLLAPKIQNTTTDAENLYYRVQAFNHSLSSPATPLARARVVSPE